MGTPFDRNLLYGQSFEETKEHKLEIRLWDVGHGLSIWIRTPNGQNHWIDTGKNSQPSFEPASYVKKCYKDRYGVNIIHYLIITHPDRDHYNGIKEFFDVFDEVKVICRNAEYINKNKNTLFNKNIECDNAFLNIHNRYNTPVPPSADPRDEKVNGGVIIKTFYAPYKDGMSVNNSSLITFYKFSNCVFITPGDIEEKGWISLYSKYCQEVSEIIKGTKSRILVAPHHGRTNGYIQNMMDILRPTLILISDKRSSHETDPKFRTVASGECVDGKIVKFSSTVTSGRIKITINTLGNVYVTTAYPRN